MAPKDAIIRVRCSTAEKLAWEARATEESMNVSSWLRSLATERVNGTNGDEPAPAFLPGFGLAENEEE